MNQISLKKSCAATDPGLSNSELKLMNRLAYSSRILSEEGHDDFNQGQVSARMPGKNNFFIKKAIIGFSEAVPEDMIRGYVDINEPLNPHHPPEIALHQGIYEARKDVNAIIHSHSPYSLVFGATDLEIKPLSHDGAYFQGRINRFNKTSQTILNIDTGRAVAKALGNAHALFLQNHGALVVGKSIRETTVLALLLERACKLQLIAESLQRDYSVSTEEDVQGKKGFIYDDTAIKSYWDYCVRRINQLKLNNWENNQSNEE